MDAFRLSLDRLDRESKELISAAQQAACEAVLKHKVLPSHVALALAQRFTEARIADSFPALCLVDVLVRQTGPDSVTADSAVAKAILDVFWKSAPSLFTAFQHLRDDGIMRKCECLVHRWGTNKLISNTLETQLIAAMTERHTAEPMKEGADLGQSSGPSSGQSATTGTATSSSAPTGSAPSALAVTGTTPNMTHQEVEIVAHTLRNCLAIMERLPPERAYLYVQLLEEEGGLSAGLQSTSLATLQSLWGDLQRDAFVLSARGLGSAAASAVGATPRSSAPMGEGDAGAGLAASAAAPVGAASSEAVAALGQLLERLSTTEAGGAAPAHTATVLTTPLSGHALPPALAAPTQPIRYVSPLLSDALALQSLQQRLGGHGPLLARKVSGGPGGAGYYPRFSSLCVSRRFRPRVAAPGSASRSQRRAFPTSQEWVSTADMERLALIDNEEDPPASRKRERE